MTDLNVESKTKTHLEVNAENVFLFIGVIKDVY